MRSPNIVLWVGLTGYGKPFIRRVSKSVLALRPNAHPILACYRHAVCFPRGGGTWSSSDVRNPIRRCPAPANWKAAYRLVEFCTRGCETLTRLRSGWAARRVGPTESQAAVRCQRGTRWSQPFIAVSRYVAIGSTSSSVIEFGSVNIPGRHLDAGFQSHAAASGIWVPPRRQRGGGPCSAATSGTVSALVKSLRTGAGIGSPRLTVYTVLRRSTAESRALKLNPEN